MLVVVFSTAAFGAGSRGKRLAVTGLLGLPHPVNIGLDYRLGDKLSLGVTAGIFAFNYNFGSDRYKIATQNVEGRIRFFPLGGAFFIGCAAGTQNVTGDTARVITSSGISVDVSAKGEISNMYIIPHIGWFRTAANGFTIGFEAGVYMPMGANSNISLTSTNPLIALVQSTAEYQSLQADATKFGNDVGSMTLPFLTILRIGWAF